MAWEVTIRPFEPKDVGGVIELLNRVLIPDPMTSEVFQERVLLDLNFDPQGAPVAKADGKIVGFMLGTVRKYLMEDQAPDTDRGYITLIAVDSDYQRRGIGTKLWEHVHAYFKSRGAKVATVSTYAPNYFWPGVDVNAYAGAVEFFKKHGFTVPITVLSMDASLINFKTPDWIIEKEKQLASEGVIIDSFKPEYILPLLDHLRREFPGDWQRYIRESMVRITRGDFDRGEVYAAMEGAKCIGFCQHEGEHFGPFGVDQAERGRGIGAVLLLRCLRDMRAKGMHTAWFNSTTDDAARIYSYGGFKESRRYAVMRREI
jgi:ribosomal protein S18 acetylase RimI-like enzyme